MTEPKEPKTKNKKTLSQKEQEEVDELKSQMRWMARDDDVTMYLDEEEDTLTIEFGKGRNVQMVLNNDAEKEIVQAFLDDPNTWAVFLNALSQPLQEHA